MDNRKILVVASTVNFGDDYHTNCRRCHREVFIKTRTPLVIHQMGLTLAKVVCDRCAPVTLLTDKFDFLYLDKWPNEIREFQQYMSEQISEVAKIIREVQQAGDEVFLETEKCDRRQSECKGCPSQLGCAKVNILLRISNFVRYGDIWAQIKPNETLLESAQKVRSLRLEVLAAKSLEELSIVDNELKKLTI